MNIYVRSANGPKGVAANEQFQPPHSEKKSTKASENRHKAKCFLRITKTAKRTKQLVERYGLRKSMSRPGTPSDNQPIESFWRTLENEMADIRHLTYREATKQIIEYTELYYNSERLHSGINYAVPNEFFHSLIYPKNLTSFKKLRFGFQTF